MELTHYSPSPILKLDQRPYVQGRRPTRFEKPEGFWVSVDGPDDWKQFCEAESFRLEELAVPHRVILSKDARLLLISNLAEFDAFEEEYSSPDPILIMGAIRWTEVAKKYQGIIVAPYQWERRMSSDWYYPWDCASGCIWDIAAVELTYPLPASHSVPVVEADEAKS